MAAPRGPHHSGTFNRRSAQLNRAATANPHTICWRDGLTLNQHQPHKTGRPARWTTGHLDPTRGDLDTAQRHGAHIVYIDGRPCSHEVSTCNYTDGAITGNRNREPTSNWLH